MTHGQDDSMSGSTGPRRILFVGVTGSGKSTLAIQLGALAGLPVHLVDEQVGWLPGWIQRSVEDQRRIAMEWAAAPTWVMDSAYGHYRQKIAEHAELIVCLDYPRLVSLGRLVRRSIRRVITAEPVCNGNIETWTRLFSADSILAWHWRSFASKRAQMDTFLAVYGPEKVLRFRRPSQTRKWMEAVRASGCIPPRGTP